MGVGKREKGDLVDDAYGDIAQQNRFSLAFDQFDHIVVAANPHGTAHCPRQIAAETVPAQRIAARHDPSLQPRLKPRGQRIGRRHAGHFLRVGTRRHHARRTCLTHAVRINIEAVGCSPDAPARKSKARESCDHLLVRP